MARSRDDDDDDRDDLDDGDDDVDVRRNKKKGGSRSAAIERLSIPSICLIVVASIHAALSCLGLPLAVFAIIQGPRAFGQGPMADALAGNPVQNLGSSIVGLLVQAFIIFGAIQMKGAKMYGVSMAMAILSVIPCLCSSCGILGIPFGIWALILLMDPEVKSAFTS